jgi:hypothetical protein
MPIGLPTPKAASTPRNSAPHCRLPESWCCSYWQIGRDILARQAAQGWGAKVIERLALDLRAAFAR